METEVSIDFSQIASELELPTEQINRTIQLLDDGNTVPFITRYRKDQTGGLDERQIRLVQDRFTKLRLLAERKTTILKSIQSQDRLTLPLAEQIREARSLKRLEDLYLPFKPKKQTLATLARRRGLEPLADEVVEGKVSADELVDHAKQFVRVDKELYNMDDVMQGVGHLLAEKYSEQAELRAPLRKILWSIGKLVSMAAAPRSTEEPSVLDKADRATNPTAKRQLDLLNLPSASGSVEELSSEQTAQSEPTAEVEPTSTVERISTEQPTESAKSSSPDASHESTDKKKKEKDKLKNAFKDYFDYTESLDKVPPHRVLAINRGERAKVLRVKIEVDGEVIQEAAEQLLVPEEHLHADFLRDCLRDALTRLVLPSLEREARRELTERAERHAVEVFARNLRNLLLQAPVHGRRVLAIDPGFRSGCKIVALDEFGQVLGDDLVHIVGNAERMAEGRKRLVSMIEDNHLSIIAIGNGTACRQTEQLVGDILAIELSDRGLEYTIVNEAGASVYSTSEIGREELPLYDATVRGAVSIGRRLLDPLSELVKINAANIGVGLYQHDVKGNHLRLTLDEVVASCVNYVGVDVNTASPSLLRYVSGLNQLTARRVYDYRREHGPYRNREQLKEVPSFGDATFVQAAGFLKITQGDNPLDATWIHPESYEVATRILAEVGGSIDELRQDPASVSARPPDTLDPPAVSATSTLQQRLAAIEPATLAKQLNTGRLLLEDILTNVARPGRDPREDLSPPVFRRGIMKIEDLKEGMELDATVLNVVDFGAFVDIGLSDSGLIHISRLADRFVNDPHEVVSVGDRIRVWVLEVDRQRRRISLTAIEPGTEKPPEQRTQLTRQRPARTDRSAERRHNKRKDRVSKGGQRQLVKSPKYSSRKIKKPKPVKPITKDMADGKEPMRSFSDLKQFFDIQDDPASETGNEQN